MKCRKARKLILSYAELSFLRKKRLDDHLSSCLNCSREFSSYLKSIDLCKEASCFEESKDFWSDYRIDLDRKIAKLPIWSRIWTRVEGVAGYFLTPVLGPVPAYIFSFLLIALLTIGLYPTLFATEPMGSFKNDMVAQELEVRGAFDDGEYSH
jgi:hypothetical protein